MTDSDDINERVRRHNGPVHGAFGLTYASYLVWPRALMQDMPIDWQERFVELLDAFWDTWDAQQCDLPYEVHLRGEDGRYRRDPLSNYRHIGNDALDSRKRKTA